MVCDLAAVENRAFTDWSCAKTIFRQAIKLCYSSDKLRDDRLHVLGQIPAVSSRIGHQLLLIEALGVIQRLLSGEAQDTVSISL